MRKYLKLLDLPEDLRLHLGTGDGPSGIGALSRLASTFDNPDDQRDAYEKLHGFTGGQVENILKRSGGNMDKLDALREQAL